jgi:hypothetical protein
MATGSALNFLFQGTQPAQGTNYSQGQSNVPTWLQEYTQGIIAQANALASQPYQQYGAPRIAGFTPQQTQAQNEVSNIQGQYQAPLGQAQQLATSSANPTALSTAQSYLPQAASDINSTISGVNQGYAGAQSYLPQANTMIQSALTPSAAMMNPYAQNVIGQAETQAGQFFTNQLLPQIQQQYAAAGQAGSSADLRAELEQANQLTENIQARVTLR